MFAVDPGLCVCALDTLRAQYILKCILGVFGGFGHRMHAVGNYVGAAGDPESTAPEHIVHD